MGAHQGTARAALWLSSVNGHLLAAASETGGKSWAPVPVVDLMVAGDHRSLALKGRPIVHGCHPHSRAKEAGASDEELAQVKAGFVKIARELLDEQAPQRRRRPINPFRRHPGTDELPAGRKPKQLPPGPI
jgi:hypothetical protein